MKKGLNFCQKSQKFAKKNPQMLRSQKYFTKKCRNLSFKSEEIVRKKHKFLD